MPNDEKLNRSKFFNGPLYDQTTEDLHLTGKGQRTVHGYLRAVHQLAEHCRKAPFHPLAFDEMVLNRLAFAAHSKTGSEPAALEDCADGESRSFSVEICVVQQLAKTV